VTHRHSRTGPRSTISAPHRLRRLAVIAMTVSVLAACTSSPSPQLPAPPKEPVTLAASSESVMVMGTTPEEVTARASQALFDSSPAAIMVDAGAIGDLPAAGIPVLLVSAQASPGATPSGVESAANIAAVDAELDRLGADTVLALGPHATAVAQGLGVTVVSEAGALPEFERAEGKPATLVITAGPAESGLDEATTAVVAATSAAAGATHVPTTSGDPRATRESVDVIAGATPTRVIGVGAGLGDQQQLADRVEAAATGTQLPGGGQTHHPGKLYVALYGHPGAPSLGVLGEQDLDASVQRAKEHARDYEGLTGNVSVPMFEIITTVALADPSPNGNYTREVDPETIRPWAERAGAEGIYVVLDLQPGRADLLDQARKYESLLRLPNVGLAIDPEWKLGPTQRPLQQIGSVQAEEINRVSEWLAGLTADQNLPQKLFILHQFQARMIPDRDRVVTDHDELQTLIHVDGQGAQPDKQATWAVIKQNAPPNVVWGWKNFYDEDQPTLTPQQTVEQVDPTPVMISYQ
jgi:hypothetical protein